MRKSIPIVAAVLGTLGLLSFANVAISEETATSSEPSAVTQEATSSSSVIIANGSEIKFDQDRASIVPIVGWQVEPKGSGMALVMKEVVKKVENAPVDYSQPLFTRNITVLSMKDAAPIDETRATEFKEEFSKIVARDGVMKDFQFNSHKFFNYKGENDGLVMFAQHTSNGFPMMQMMILVSGDSKQYLLTYTDLASNFANQETYDAAWKSMTSISVAGVAPQRYMREMKIGGAVLAGVLLIVLPFGFARFASQRRIRKMVDALENDWDKGSNDASALESSVSRLGTTRVAMSLATTGARMNSSVSSFDDESISTRKSRFKFSSHG